MKCHASADGELGKRLAAETEALCCVFALRCHRPTQPPWVQPVIRQRNSS
jgi:hypothetical protein